MQQREQVAGLQVPVTQSRHAGRYLSSFRLSTSPSCPQFVAAMRPNCPPNICAGVETIKRKLQDYEQTKQFHLGAGVTSTVGGSNPDSSKRFFSFQKHPDRPWGPPSLLTMGTGSFPGVKRPEMLPTHLHPMHRLRINGVIPLFALHAFMAPTQTALTLHIHNISV